MVSLQPAVASSPCLGPCSAVPCFWRAPTPQPQQVRVVVWLAGVCRPGHIGGVCLLVGHCSSNFSCSTSACTPPPASPLVVPQSLAAVSMGSQSGGSDADSACCTSGSRGVGVQRGAAADSTARPPCRPAAAGAAATISHLPLELLGGILEAVLEDDAACERRCVWGGGWVCGCIRRRCHLLDVGCGEPPPRDCSPPRQGRRQPAAHRRMGGLKPAATSNTPCGA